MASNMLFHLFVLCYFGVFVQSSPTINGPSEHVPVQLNGSATLQCSPSVASSSVSWYRGSPFATLSPVLGEEDYHTSTNNGSLTITGFMNHTHGGEYLCKASSDSNALLSCPATVSLAKISTEFVSEPSDIVVTMETMTVLKCSPPESNPPADVYWLKDDSVFLMDSSESIQSGSGNLYLLNVTEDDEGYYQCVAENKVTGEKRYTRKALLTVIDHSIPKSPSFLVTPSNVTVALNGVAEFECFINDDSIIIWEWMGHASLPANSIVDDHGVLVIFGISRALDGAVFKCVSISTALVVMVSNAAHLTVTTIPKPSIIGQLRGEAGTSTTLYCVNQEASLTGEVSVAWQVSGTVVKQEQTVNGASAHTFDITSDGSGEMWIQCMMRSEHGCMEKTVVIEVEEPATTAPPPLSLFLSPTLDPSYLPISGSLNLTCNVLLHQPAPFITIVWKDSDGQTIPTAAQTNVGQFYTSIISVSSPDTYKCEVVLLIGGPLETFSESIVVYAAVTVDTVTPTSTLGPSTVAMTTDSISVPVTATPVPVQPVVPPTHRPGNLTLTWFNDLLLVSWTHPPMASDSNTDIIGYKLNWGVADRYLAQVALRAVPYDYPRFVIGGLDKNDGTEYRVMVWAYSIGGDGPSTVASTDEAKEFTEYSPPVAMHPNTSSNNSVSTGNHPLDRVMEVSHCISILPDQAMIGIKFTDFHFSLINEFDHFVIDYTCASAGINETVTRQSLPVFLDHLQPGCSYNVTVSVVNDKGEPIIAPDSCSFVTLGDGIDPIVFHAWWVDPSKGTLSLTWDMALFLLDVDISIETYSNGEWIVISNGENLTYNPYENPLIPVRVLIGNTVIQSLSISVLAYYMSSSPSSPTPTSTISSSSVSINTPWVTYGVGLCSVVLSIVAVLTLVLVLKHIQTKRRRENQNLKQKYHKRLSSLSSQKSLFSSREDSTQSIKTKAASTPTIQPNNTTTVNNIYTLT